MNSFFKHTILIGEKLFVDDYIMLSHELCAHSASFIDQYGDLGQGTKSSLMAKLAVYITDQLAYEFKLLTTLPPRKQITRSTANKKVFLQLLSKCFMGDGIEITRKRYRYYDHKESVIKMVSYT